MKDLGAQIDKVKSKLASRLVINNVSEDDLNAVIKKHPEIIETPVRITVIYSAATIKNLQQQALAVNKILLKFRQVRMIDLKLTFPSFLVELFSVPQDKNLTFKKYAYINLQSQLLSSTELVLRLPDEINESVMGIVKSLITSGKGFVELSPSLQVLTITDPSRGKYQLKPEMQRRYLAMISQRREALIGVNAPSASATSSTRSAEKPSRPHLPPKTVKTHSSEQLLPPATDTKQRSRSLGDVEDIPKQGSGPEATAETHHDIPLPKIPHVAVDHDSDEDIDDKFMQIAKPTANITPHALTATPSNSTENTQGAFPMMTTEGRATSSTSALEAAPDNDLQALYQQALTRMQRITPRALTHIPENDVSASAFLNVLNLQPTMGKVEIESDQLFNVPFDTVYHDLFRYAVDQNSDQDKTYSQYQSNPTPARPLSMAPDEVEARHSGRVYAIDRRPLRWYTAYQRLSHQIDSLNDEIKIIKLAQEKHVTDFRGDNQHSSLGKVEQMLRESGKFREMLDRRFQEKAIINTKLDNLKSEVEQSGYAIEDLPEDDLGYGCRIFGLSDSGSGPFFGARSTINLSSFAMSEDVLGEDEFNKIYMDMVGRVEQTSPYLALQLQAEVDALKHDLADAIELNVQRLARWHKVKEDLQKPENATASVTEQQNRAMTQEIKRLEDRLSDLRDNEKGMSIVRANWVKKWTSSPIVVDQRAKKAVLPSAPFISASVSAMLGSSVNSDKNVKHVFQLTPNGYVDQFNVSVQTYLAQILKRTTKKDPETGEINGQFDANYFIDHDFVFRITDESGQSNSIVTYVINRPRPSFTQPLLPMLQLVETQAVVITFDGTEVGELVNNITLAPLAEKTMVVEATTKITESVNRATDSTRSTQKRVTSDFTTNLKSELSNTDSSARGTNATTSSSRDASSAQNQSQEREEQLDSALKTNNQMHWSAEASMSLGFDMFGMSASGEGGGSESVDKEQKSRSQTKQQNTLSRAMQVSISHEGSVSNNQSSESSIKNTRDIISNTASETSEENSVKITASESKSYEQSTTNREEHKLKNPNFSTPLNFKYFSLYNRFRSAVHMKRVSVVIRSGKPLLDGMGIRDAQVADISEVFKLKFRYPAGDGYNIMLAAVVARKIIKHYGIRFIDDEGQHDYPEHRDVAYPPLLEVNAKYADYKSSLNTVVSLSSMKNNTIPAGFKLSTIKGDLTKLASLKVRYAERVIDREQLNSVNSGALWIHGEAGKRSADDAPIEPFLAQSQVAELRENVAEEHEKLANIRLLESKAAYLDAKARAGIFNERIDVLQGAGNQSEPLPQPTPTNVASGPQ